MALTIRLMKFLDVLHLTLFNFRKESKMKWLLDLKIGTKLISGFSAVAIITSIVGWMAYTDLQEAKDLQDTLYLDRLIPIRDLGYANAALLIARAEVRNLLSSKTIDQKQEYVKIVNEQTILVDNLIESYSKTVLVKEEEETLPKFLDNWKNYKTVRDKGIQLALAGKTVDAQKLFDGESRLFQNEARKYLRALIDINAKVANDLDKQSDEMMVSAQTTLFMFAIFAAILAVFLGVVVSRIISKPINELVKNIDNADLHSQFNSVRKDEIGDLQRSFDKFVVSIKDTLVQVSEASAAVASASTEISSSTEQMAAGAQEQSSQASEVATAVEEMTKTLGETNSNIRKVADGAKEAKDNANAGGAVVEDTVKGMKKISDVVNQSAQQVKVLGASSEKIGEIVGVINDIADQTNLLALNAAIEAARAGEQGRGFAVVADEVRKLAERTSKATKEIASMIKQIQVDTNQAVLSMDKGTEEVGKGITLAEQAGQMLLGIVGNAESVADMVGQIAAASEQQASASEQISKNVEAISTVSQESASGVQQIAKTAEDLNRLTENLQQLLERFNLGGSEQQYHQQSRTTSKKSYKQKSTNAVSENGHLVEHY